MTKRLGDMIREIRNPNLSRQRLEEIVRELNEFGDRSEKQKSWTRFADSRINPDVIDFQFELLFSSVLEADKASVVINNIPTTFRNIIIMASGSITSANGGNVWAQFNDDTGGANYSWQFVKADGATISGGEDSTFHGVALGVFGTTGAGAGVNGSFRAEILHLQGPWKKNVLSHAYTAEFNDLYVLGSTWAKTEPIYKIEIFGTDNTLVKGTTNLAAGSLFTIYGVK